MMLTTQRLYDPLTPLESLEEQLRAKHDDFRYYHIAASNIRMVPDTGNLAISTDYVREYPLQEQALDQIAVKLRIPATYLKRCPTELRAVNVNHWLDGLRNKLMMLRFDGREVRAILTPQYVPISNLELVSNLRELTAEKNLRIRVRFEWTPSRFIAQIVEESRDFTGAGDTVLQGLHIINSETGHASLSVSAMLYRLICTNGMTLTDALSFRRTHRRDARTLTEDLQQMFGQIWTKLPEFVEPMSYLQTRQLQEPEEEIQKMVKRYKLSDDAHESLKRAWAIEPGGTEVYLLHALTRAGNDPQLALSERTELQRIGGLMLKPSA